MNGSVLRTAVSGLSLTLLLAACGTAPEGTSTTRVALAGWRSVPDSPGISQLAPDLSGLRIVSRTDRRALVRRGNAVRSSTFTFATSREAEEAQKRGAGDDYQGQLERAFRGETIGNGPGTGLRLRVPRPSGAGSDAVEVYLIARSRAMIVIELLSARGFDPALRTRVLGLLSRGTAGG